MGIIKVTVDDELEAKLRAAAHFDQQTLSAYCRRLLLDGVRNVRVPLEAIAKVLPRMPDVEPTPPARVVPDTRGQQIVEEMRREIAAQDKPTVPVSTPAPAPDDTWDKFVAARCRKLGVASLSPDQEAKAQQDFTRWLLDG